MVVAEARRPPVFQQVRREEIAIVASFEIAIVHQNFECVRNTARCIVNHLGVQSFDDLMAFPCSTDLLSTNLLNKSQGGTI